MKEPQTVKSVLQGLHNNHIVLMTESLVTGVLTGFVITAFRKSIDFFSHLRENFYAAITVSNRFLLLPVFAGAAVLGLLMGYLIKKYPMIKGSGISQIKGNFMKKLNLSPWPELPLKFFGGVLDIAAGLSVGREGPSVQIGAYVGSAVERIGERSHIEKLCLITSGVAAGLSATFGAPFAGVVFAIEDLHQYLSPLLLTCVMTGAFAGDFVTSVFFKPGAVFDFKNIRLFPLKYFGCLIFLGIITALIGHLFKKSIYQSQGLYTKLKIPARIRPVIPFLLSVPVCLFLPLAASGGDGLIELLAEHGFTARFLLMLLAAKIVFTGLSAGSGVIGGIFVPLLSCGALTGILFSKFLVYFGLIEAEYAVNLMIFAMAGFFTTVIKAPLTAAVLLLEISGNLFHLGGLLITVLVSYITAELIHSPANDEVLLRQILSDTAFSVQPDGNSQGAGSRAGGGRSNRYDKELFEICIGPESFLDGKPISAVQWPYNCLIVGLSRGEEEIIPNGKTVLSAGDRLVILTGSENISEDMSAISALANKGED